MAAEDLIPTLQTAVGGFNTTVDGKQTTIDTKVSSGTTARNNAQTARNNAEAARDTAEQSLKAAYTAAQSAKSAVDYQDLAALAAEKAINAVDVFVYDTSKDSDGGAWRKRCSKLSWYNEPLNTATRGSRREFPSVAVIVATNSSVTIYDGDDPTLPMWMVFYTGGGKPIYAAPSCTAAVNGTIVVGQNGGAGGVTELRFVEDTAFLYINNNTIYNKHPILDRNNSFGIIVAGVGLSIINRTVNDVAMTVLPDAPIDAATGLPVPTIAVATSGGVSVIKDDGTVVDVTCSNASFTYSFMVAFDGQKLIAELGATSPTNPGSYVYVFNQIPDSDTVITLNTKTGSTVSADAFYSYQASSLYYDLPLAGVGANYGAPAKYANSVFNGKTGIVYLDENPVDSTKGMVAYTTSTYNTGWMPGAIRGAFLADTDETDLVGFSATESFDYATQQDAETAGLIFSGSGFSFSSGAITFSAVGDTVKIPVSGLISGGRYKVSFEVLSGGAAIRVQAGPNTGPGYASWLNPIASVGYFTATQTTGSFGVQLSGGGPIEIGAVYLESVDYDRSIANKPLTVNGTITRTPVATGAELVAYSGFNASNYLEQPYNSDLDFGTGDLCIMGWFKQNSNGNHRSLVVREPVSPASGDPFIRVTRWADGRNTFELGNYGVNSSAAEFTDSSLDNWYFLVGLRRNGVLEIYQNGVLRGTATDTRNVDHANAVLRLGRGVYFGVPMALVRISATAPTAEQIKKIYEDERHLFQENAACTLYGTSDAVTALAYDEDTDLLHVGTSSGRSVFKGLRRVDNTTVAVGTAISASNGLVVEE